MIITISCLLAKFFVFVNENSSVVNAGSQYL